MSSRGSLLVGVTNQSVTFDVADAQVGGFERVFELGRIFRNEGVSSRHNPEVGG
jgi:hypothetical protein